MPTQRNNNQQVSQGDCAWLPVRESSSKHELNARGFIVLTRQEGPREALELVQLLRTPQAFPHPLPFLLALRSRRAARPHGCKMAAPHFRPLRLCSRNKECVGQKAKDLQSLCLFKARKPIIFQGALPSRPPLLTDQNRVRWLPHPQGTPRNQDFLGWIRCCPEQN